MYLDDSTHWFTFVPSYCNPSPLSSDDSKELRRSKKGDYRRPHLSLYREGRRSYYEPRFCSKIRDIPLVRCTCSGLDIALYSPKQEGTCHGPGPVGATEGYSVSTFRSTIGVREVYPVKVRVSVGDVRDRLCRTFFVVEAYQDPSARSTRLPVYPT